MTTEFRDKNVGLVSVQSVQDDECEQLESKVGKSYVEHASYVTRLF